MIELEFHTTDPAQTELFRRYWQLNRDGTFKESLKTLLADHPDLRSGGFALSRLVTGTARDSRHRCPTCGTGQQIGSREDFLAAVPLMDSCHVCKALRSSLPGFSHGHTAGPAHTFRYPIGALAILDAMSGVVQFKELRDGFSWRDCEGLAPAQIKRFLDQLCAADMIKRGASPVCSRRTDNASMYHLENDPALELDLAEFRRQLAGGRTFDHRAILELWLDYAVAEAVAFLFRQYALLGLPGDPEEEKLCSVLRTALTAYSISEVWAISRFAVERATNLVDHGRPKEEAVARIPSMIARQCRNLSMQDTRPDAIPRRPGDSRPVLSEWFYGWYGVYVHTRGKDVTDSVRPARSQDA
jgi:hypothetical protein